MIELKEKNALITGATSGIGQAIAIKLAQQGCNIAINYRKSPEAGVRLDILVKNAGIQTESPSHKLTTADFDRVIAVNLRGAYLCACEEMAAAVASLASDEAAYITG